MHKSLEESKERKSEDNIEFEIEMDDDHIIVDKKNKTDDKNKKKDNNKKNPPSTEGQITLDFE